MAFELVEEKNWFEVRLVYNVNVQTQRLTRALRSNFNTFEFRVSNFKSELSVISSVPHGSADPHRIP